MKDDPRKLAALSFCLEYLHRHPNEVDLPTDDLVDIMAYDRIKKETTQ